MFVSCVNCLWTCVTSIGCNILKHCLLHIWHFPQAIDASDRYWTRKRRVMLNIIANLLCSAVSPSAAEHSAHSASRVGAFTAQELAFLTPLSVASTEVSATT